MKTLFLALLIIMAAPCCLRTAVCISDSNSWDEFQSCFMDTYWHSRSCKK